MEKNKTKTDYNLTNTDDATKHSFVEYLPTILSGGSTGYFAGMVLAFIKSGKWDLAPVVLPALFVSGLSSYLSIKNQNQR